MMSPKAPNLTINTCMARDAKPADEELHARYPPEVATSDVQTLVFNLHQRFGVLAEEFCRRTATLMLSVQLRAKMHHFIPCDI